MPLANYPVSITFPKEVVMTYLGSHKTRECSCDECKSMCINPCWPTPDEARELIDNGYADKLILRRTQVKLDGEHNYYEPVWILSIADKKHHSTLVDSCYNECIFWNSDKMCDLHGTDFKPLEAMLAYHKEDPEDPFQNELHEWIIESWCNNDALRLIEEWAELVGYELEGETYEDEVIVEEPKKLSGDALEIKAILDKIKKDYYE